MYIAYTSVYYIKHILISEFRLWKKVVIRDEHIAITFKRSFFYIFTE